MKKRGQKFKKEFEPREVPSYAIPEAAHYLRMPVTTLRAWVLGQSYKSHVGEKRIFRPILALPERGQYLLSFNNLVEAHILNAIRKKHGVALQKVRVALGYLRKEFGSDRPLLEESFETDGLDLFVDRFGQLINISRAGQLAMRSILEIHLERIERDERGLPIKLFPFTRKWLPNEPKTVVIDPLVSFGRPVLAGTGIPTAIIAERYKAGESIEELAEDFERETIEIEEAIRCELQVEAA